MTTVTDFPSLKDLSASWTENYFKEQQNPGWLIELRLRALSQFQAMPWPAKNDQKWKRSELPLLQWDRLTFSPTRNSDLTEQVTAPPEATVLPLEKALMSHEDALRRQWSAAFDKAAGNKFLLLSLALGNGGVCVFVPKNKTLSTPIHRTFSGGQSGKAYFPLNFFIMEENSEAQIWDDFGGGAQADAPFFLSNYSGLLLKQNARMGFTSLQHWDAPVRQFQFHHITQQQQSRFNSVAAFMGARVFRNELEIDLQGTGAENRVLGVLFGEDKQNFENWVTQNHLAPKTTSDIQIRGALKGSSKSFFSGLVSIIKEAQQSDAYQSAKSLLLSDQARADAIPNLEILADDVKCSHGAAVGPVDAEQKFYLRSRGIAPEQAEHMIVEGFFEPVINNIPSETEQNRLRAFIEKKLKAG